MGFDMTISWTGNLKIKDAKGVESSTGTDKQLARLKRNYAQRRDLMKALRELDLEIEVRH